MKKISNLKNVLTTVVVLSLVGVIPGCQSPKPDPCHCVSSKRWLAESRDTYSQISNRISALLTSFAVVEPIALIINEPYRMPVPDIAQATLQPLEGLYQEDLNAPGTFLFIWSPGSISVHFLNGIKALFSGSKYNAANKLVSYTVTVSSSEFTPTADKVSMTLTEERLNTLGFLPGIESGGMRMIGDVTFNFRGTPTSFKINRAVGQYSDPTLIASHGEGFRYHIVESGSNEFYRIDSVQTYIPSDVAGKWVALYRSEFYADRLIRADINLGLQNGAANLSQATYVRLGGGISFGRQRHASLTGGPYVCDLEQPLDPGSGTPIKFTYILEEGEDEVLPGEQFTCENMSMPDPTL